MNPESLQFRKSLFLLVFPIAFSLAFLNYHGRSYLLHFPVWAIAFAASAFQSPSKRWRAISLGLFGVFCSLFIAECGLWIIKARSLIERTSDSKLYVSHKVLGKAPPPGIRIGHQARVGERLLYDVHYTIDEYGYRVQPKPKAPNAPAIIFTGGSFTFGEGIEDDETYPHRIAQMLDGQFRVCNWAFKGYGPHQMLANFRNELYEDSLGDSAPLVVVYLAIPHHVHRVVGAASWGQVAPRFVETADGSIERRGTFEDSATFKEKLRFLVLREANKSSIGQRVVRYRATSEDVELWLKIVLASRAEFQKSYPDTRFVVVTLSGSGRVGKLVRAALADSDLDHLELLDSLPNLRDDEYKIPYDGHPNAVANEKIAEFMMEKILNSPKRKSINHPSSHDSP